MMLLDAAVGPPLLDPLALLLVALLVEAGVGEMRPLFRVVRHPVRLIGDLVDVLERKLNRPHRSAVDRAMRGALTVALVAGLAGGVGLGLAALGRLSPWGVLPEFLLLVALLAQRELFDRVRAVGRALAGDGLAAGRRAVAHLVGRDPERLDEFGVSRAAIESLAENFSDAVVAPVFWYAVLGLPGLMIHKAVNTMDSMIGHRSERYRAFGFVAARLDDVLNLIPARLSALFIAAAAFVVPSARPGRAFAVAVRDAGKHRSPNAGWPEGAMAGALGLALAGPRVYADYSVNDPWIGDGRAMAGPRDIRRALYVYAAACLINAGFVATILVMRTGG